MKSCCSLSVPDLVTSPSLRSSGRRPYARGQPTPRQRRPTTDEQIRLPPLESGVGCAACATRPGPERRAWRSPGPGELGCCRLPGRLRKRRNQPSSSSISSASWRPTSATASPGEGAFSVSPAAALPRLLRSSSGVQAGASRSTGKAALSTAECRVQAKAAARRAAGAAVVLLSSRMEGVTPPRDTAWAMPEERADRPATLLFWFDGGVVAGR